MSWDVCLGTLCLKLKDVCFTGKACVEQVRRMRFHGDGQGMAKELAGQAPEGGRAQSRSRVPATVDLTEGGVSVQGSSGSLAEPASSINLGTDETKDRVEDAEHSSCMAGGFFVSSTGQLTCEGFIKRDISCWIRRNLSWYHLVVC